MGAKKSSRGVFWRVVKAEQPDQISYCKHLAFHTRYHRIGSDWYMEITPDWFVSRDGYRKSLFAAENITRIKREEGNRDVFNDFRFIAYFLKRSTEIDLFDAANRRRVFLNFGRLTSFGSAPALDDEEWNSPKTKRVVEDASPDLDDLQDILTFD